MEASGTVAKLDSIKVALHFYHVRILADDDDTAGDNKSKITSNLVQSWREVYKRGRNEMLS